MWHSGSGQGRQGGLGEATAATGVVGLPTCVGGVVVGDPMSEGRDGCGVRPKISSPTANPDCKSFNYDSSNDSGFLSGSNLLVSSSSLNGDDTTMRCHNLHNTTGGDHHNITDNTTTASTSPLHYPHHDQRSPTDPKTQQQQGLSPLGSSRLDSGIDISDQLSSLHLVSPSNTTSSCSNSLDTGLEIDSSSSTSSPIRKQATTPQPRRSRLGLNETQVALLQEIFQRDEDGDTQLHVAVMRGFIEVVYNITRLLPHQAFLDLANHNGKTALHLAVAAGDAGVARHLVVCGASPVDRDRRGNTPLHLASAQGHLLMVTQLTRPVTVAEVINARLSYAPAHTAGLLAADLTNYDGQTCIHVAAQGGYKDILQHLTWYGADINAREGKSGRTALHYAVEARDASLVEFLTESCRVSLSLETYAGLTPYQLALANGATGLANLLLELGAPSDALPTYLTADDDLDYDEVTAVSTENSNGWGTVDDLRIGGVPVPMAMPVPVDNNPFNADLYL